MIWKLVWCFLWTLKSLSLSEWFVISVGATNIYLFRHSSSELHRDFTIHMNVFNLKGARGFEFKFPLDGIIVFQDSLSYKNHNWRTIDCFSIIYHSLMILQIMVRHFVTRGTFGSISQENTRHQELHSVLLNSSLMRCKCIVVLEACVVGVVFWTCLKISGACSFITH